MKTIRVNLYIHIVLTPQLYIHLTFQGIKHKTKNQSYINYTFATKTQKY